LIINEHYQKGIKALAQFDFFSSLTPQDSMDIKEQEQKFHQSLDQLSHSTTQLTNTLV